VHVLLLVLMLLGMGSELVLAETGNAHVATSTIPIKDKKPLSLEDDKAEVAEKATADELYREKVKALNMREFIRREYGIDDFKWKPLSSHNGIHNTTTLYFLLSSDSKDGQIFGHDQPDPLFVISCTSRPNTTKMIGELYFTFPAFDRLVGPEYGDNVSARLKFKFLRGIAKVQQRDDVYLRLKLNFWRGDAQLQQGNATFRIGEEMPFTQPLDLIVGRLFRQTFPGNIAYRGRMVYGLGIRDVDDIVSFLKKLKNTQQLLVDFDPPNDRGHVVKYNITGIDKVLSSLRSTCHWNL